jgi:hypothetical protein
MYITVTPVQFAAMLKAAKHNLTAKWPVVFLFDKLSDDNCVIQTVDAYINLRYDPLLQQLFADVGKRISLAATLASDDQIFANIADRLFTLVQALPVEPVVPVEPPKTVETKPEEIAALKNDVNSTSDYIIELEEKAPKAIVGAFFEINHEYMKIEETIHHNKYKVHRGSFGSTKEAHKSGTKVLIFKDDFKAEPRHKEPVATTKTINHTEEKKEK